MFFFQGPTFAFCLHKQTKLCNNHHNSSLQIFVKQKVTSYSSD